MSDARARGYTLLSLRKFVRRQFGEAGGRALADRLASAGFPDTMTALILPKDWRPLAEYDAAIAAVEDLFQGAHRLGRFAVEEQLHTVHRVLMRILRPAWLIENAMSVWNEYYDVGHWDVRWPQHAQVRASLRGMPRLSPAFCTMLTGWLERFFELCGVRERRVVHAACASRGAPECRFEVSWR